MFLLKSVSYPEIKDTTGKNLLIDRFLKGLLRKNARENRLKPKHFRS